MLPCSDTCVLFLALETPARDVKLPWKCPDVSGAQFEHGKSESRADTNITSSRQRTSRSETLRILRSNLSLRQNRPTLALLLVGHCLGSFRCTHTNRIGTSKYRECTASFQHQSSKQRGILDSITISKSQFILPPSFPSKPQSSSLVLTKYSPPLSGSSVI